MKAHGIAQGFVLEGRTVRLPLSFDHKSELKLLNEKHTTYKLHSYLNEETIGKCLLFSYSMASSPPPPLILLVFLLSVFFFFFFLKCKNYNII